jgi:NAD(P)H-nitrite reductase large subunit/rubredoxin
MSESQKIQWKCVVCGEVFEGAVPPDVCPVCGAGQEAFVRFEREEITHHSDEPLKIVIIGSGAAAVSAAEAVRARSGAASVTLLTRETEPPYYRPLLTKTLDTKVGGSDFFLKPSRFYEDSNISARYGTEVVSVSSSAKTVTLKSGGTVSYDKLLIAAGASCFIPPVQGADLPEVLALREHPDFERLLKLAAGGPKRVVVIGGGLLGLETAWSLLNMGHKITVLEACPCVLPRQLDDTGAGLLKKIIESHSGITAMHGVCVEEICGREKVMAVKTKDGLTIDCDIVIVSAGVRSNIGLAKTAGLKIGRAIEVDEFMRTSDPDIYAAGDCASLNGRFDGVWETALKQGKTAGANMTGDSVKYEPSLFGATLSAFGTRLFSIGDIRGESAKDLKIVCALDEVRKTYRKFVFADGRAAGGILLGDVSATQKLLGAVTSGMTAGDALRDSII